MDRPARASRLAERRSRAAAGLLPRRRGPAGGRVLRARPLRRAGHRGAQGTVDQRPPGPLLRAGQPARPPRLRRADRAWAGGPAPAVPRPGLWRLVLVGHRRRAGRRAQADLRPRLRPARGQHGGPGRLRYRGSDRRGGRPDRDAAVRGRARPVRRRLGPRLDHLRGLSRAEPQHAPGRGVHGRGRGHRRPQLHRPGHGHRRADHRPVRGRGRLADPRALHRHLAAAARLPP